ncbi:MAG: DUF3375 domain-containing protein, partial [Chloroflexota bacterium]
MDFHQLDSHTLKSPSIQLLRSQNAAFIISFLYDNFRQDPMPSIEYITLRDRLAQYLDDLRDEYPDRFSSSLSADKYLRQWADADHNWLRIRSSLDDGDSVELTSHTQRVLGWIGDLEQRSFIATSSRFQLILDQVDQLLMRSTADVETRLQQLRDEKERIEKEIARIEATGTLETLSPAEIREKFSLTTEHATQLLQDFNSVEEKFQETARDVHRLQLQPDIRKGMVIQNVLEADRLLRESDIGQSFYAFWSYLQVPQNQNTLDDQLDQLFQVDALAEQKSGNALLRGLVGYLVRAGLKVEQSNQRLAEQLRRMLDEASLAESRRIRALTADIKHLVLENRHKMPTGNFWTLETVPDSQLVMEYTLWYPPENIHYDDLPDAFDEAEPTSLDDLVDYFFVDPRLLRTRINALLETHAEVLFTDLIAHYPLEKGLSEVIAYLEIADKDRR